MPSTRKSAASVAAVGRLGSTANWPSLLVLGVGLFAVYHLALAVFMALAPHTFYVQLGPFGVQNDHYIRDVATYNAAIGVALMVAVRQISWRVPVLALVTIQFALHSLNHLIDIDRADPAWTGYFDFASLAIATLLLIGLWWTASAEMKREGGIA